MSQQQFEIENRPYLQVKVMGIDSFRTNEPWIVTFNLINIGKQPLKIISGGCSSEVEMPPFYNYLKKYAVDFNKGVTSVASGAIAEENIAINPNLGVYSNRNYIVINGEVFYQSDFTRIRHHFKFQIAIHLLPELTWQTPILSDN